MKKTILLIPLLVIISCGIALADTNVDVRVKLGSAAGAHEFEIGGVDMGPSFDTSGGNFQVEVDITPRLEEPVGYVFGAGIFGRRHEGHFGDTDVAYDASGLSLAGGISARADENLHFEGKFELDLGSGNVSLSTSGPPWPPTREGGYSAVSIIGGGYYTVSQPGLQLGLELGVQSFRGNFQSWNGAGWDDGDVRGSGGTINFTIGYRF